MNRLLIALTVVALSLTGCKGDEKKDDNKAPDKKVVEKKTQPENKAAEPKSEEPKAEERKTEEPAAGAAGVGAKAPPTVEPKTEEPAAGAAGVGTKAPPTVEPKTDDAAEVPTAQSAAEAERLAAEDAAFAKANTGKPVVVLETNLGTIKIEMTPERTPVTVKNFLEYVNDGFFADTIFHRVVPGFVIQGGGFTEDFTKKETRDSIENEAAKGIKNVRGTISMARTRARESATSQFFISLKDNAMLDYRGEHPTGWGYAAFGQVIEGMDVVDEIAAIPTVRKGPFPKPEVPSTTVFIKKAYVQ